MFMDFDTIVRIGPGQLSTSIGDEAVILNLDRGAYYGLNISGAGLWRKLQEPVRVGALHQWMLATYDVTPEVAQRDLLALLSKLADLGLIEVQHAKPTSVAKSLAN
jgi:hypothetical protein